MTHIAVLLCAGFGTRMQPLTRNRPKALLTVGGRPVLDYLMDQLVEMPQLNRSILVTNAKFHDRFKRWQETWAAALISKGLSFVLVNDGATANQNRLGACADLGLALRREMDFEAALVSAGDNIYLFPIRPLWKRFLQAAHHCLVALPEKRKRILQRSGVPVFGDGSRVLSVREKPPQPTGTRLCAPLYFLKPSAADHLNRFLQDSGRTDAPGHFIDYLCRHDPVHAFRVDARRLDIGSRAAYREAQESIPAGLNPIGRS
jgi:glucose-1-phosphate thymidylyltransferase